MLLYLPLWIEGTANLSADANQGGVTTSLCCLAYAYNFDNNQINFMSGFLSCSINWAK